MTSQDQRLLDLWQALDQLPPAERMRVIDELDADLVLDRTLDDIRKALEEPKP